MSQQNQSSAVEMPSGSLVNWKRLKKILVSGSVRIAQKEDALGLVEIFNETALTGQNSPVNRLWSEQDMQNYVEFYQSPQHSLQLIESQGTIIAWYSVKPFCWRPNLCRHTCEVAVYVRSSHLGSGLASHLLPLVLHQVLFLNYRIITGFVLSGNAASKKAIKQIGGKLWGILPSVALVQEKWSDIEIYGMNIDSFFQSNLGKRLLRTRLGAQNAQAILDALTTHAIPDSNLPERHAPDY